MLKIHIAGLSILILTLLLASILFFAPSTMTITMADVASTSAQSTSAARAEKSPVETGQIYKSSSFSPTSTREIELGALFLAIAGIVLVSNISSVIATSVFVSQSASSSASQVRSPKIPTVTFKEEQ